MEDLLLTPEELRYLESVKHNPIARTDCSSCSVKCVMGFNVRERILDVIRLRDFPV
jgi:hypothetical protein